MDKHEFGARVVAMEQSLFRVSYAILGNSADCEDAVQEAILKAFKKLDTLRQSEYFETWLTRILINECRSVLRRRRAARFVSIDEAQSAGEAIEGFEYEWLSALNPKYRLVLLLKYDEGYSTGEIAELLSLPPGTVRWRLHRARKIIEERFVAEERGL